MYPTVEELHIALDQSIQYINSNREQGLVPEEKDMLLNAAVMEFISTRSNPKTNYRKEGFEESQKRLDDLKDLKVTIASPLTAYVKDSSTVYAILPHDYLHHISSGSKVYHNCNALAYNTNSNLNKYVSVAFPKDTTGNTLKYGSFKIEITYSGTPNVTETIYSLSSVFASLTNSDSKFEIINHILQDVNTGSTNYRIYWENYDNMYIANSFIIVSIGSRVIVTGKLSYTGYNAHSATAVATVTKSSYSTNGVTNYKPNDIVSSSVNDMMFDNHYFIKNRHLRPIAWIERDRLYIHCNSDFKVIDVDLTYIKKPRPISYKLGQTCEIECGEEVIAIATRMYKAKINGQNLEGIINENLKQE